MALYGLLTPVSALIALAIVSFMVFGVTPLELLDIIQTLRNDGIEVAPL